MYTAFCIRPGCEWESSQLFGDPLRALAAVDRHLIVDHVKRPADPIRDFPDMLAVPAVGDVELHENVSYVMAVA